MKWTPERDAKLAELWPTHGANWPGWAEVLGEKCSSNTLYTRAYKIGCTKHKRGANAYTEEEERELVALVAGYCKRHNRTLGSVARKIAALHQRAVSAKRAKESVGKQPNS